MNLHEYQSKALFAQYDIPIGDSQLATTAAEAVSAAKKLAGDLWVVKAQVHAGGRGKAGGVKLARDIAEVESFANAMLGSSLQTHQTAGEGLPINSVLVEAGQNIANELYLSVLVDRSIEKIVFVASAAGGMDIEEVASKTPEQIIRVAVEPAVGISAWQTRELAFGLGLAEDLHKQFAVIIQKLYNLFVEQDAALIEINPLIITAEQQLLALDAKINLDGNALYRHPDLAAMRDASQEDEKEYEASQHDLNYVSLDGNIGCMVNGAGLAMATMDLIKLHGGEPANFLDVGGGTTAARVAEAFKLILSGSDIKAILVNIFGGIVRCDLIAEGIIQAVQEVGVNIPVVVRLEGTNVDAGRKLLKESGLDIIAADDLTEAAKKVVAAAEGAA